jgi:hypothetical protein
MVKLRVLRVDNIADGMEFNLQDKWFVHSVLKTWEANGELHALLLLEEGE